MKIITKKTFKFYGHLYKLAAQYLKKWWMIGYNKIEIYKKILNTHRSIPIQIFLSYKVLKTALQTPQHCHNTIPTTIESHRKSAIVYSAPIWKQCRRFTDLIHSTPTSQCDSMQQSRPDSITITARLCFNGWLTAWLGWYVWVD